MKFIIKSKPKGGTSKFTKIVTGLAIGMGIVMCLTNYTDSETIMAVAGATSGVITFALV